MFVVFPVVILAKQKYKGKQSIALLVFLATVLGSSDVIPTGATMSTQLLMMKSHHCLDSKSSLVNVSVHWMSGTSVVQLTSVVKCGPVRLTTCT